MVTRGPGDDEKRPDEPTPDTDGVDLGADWLMSQLDDTGVYDTVDESENERVDEAPPSRKWLRRRRRRGEAADEMDAPAADDAAGADDEGASWSLSAEADSESEDTSTQLFDVVADRVAEDVAPGSTTDTPTEAAESDAADVPTRAMPPVVSPASPVTPPTPPVTPPSAAPASSVPTPTDEPFTWNLTPNDEPDPLLAAEENESAPEPTVEPVSREPIDDSAQTQAFDPFADHEPEPLSPGEAAVAGAFAAPGAFDRLYEEATLSNLDDDEDADSATPAADDVDADDESVGVPFAPVAPGAAADAASDEPGDADADDDAETSEQAADEFAPKAAEEAPKPDLGILDLFGKSKQDAEAPAADATPETAPAPGRTEPETSDRLKALFESTATAPVVAAAQRSEPVEPVRRAAPSSAASSARPAARGSGGSGKGPDLRNLKPLTLAGLAVAAVVILGALFWVGTLLPGLVSSPAAEPTETSTPTPTASIPAEGTLPPGTYAWDQLRGGECLADYTSPWEEEFTVVPCDEDHAAQVVKVGAITDDKGAAFPGQDELASQIYLLCSAPDVLDLKAAAAYSDVQVQGSYPVNEEQWNDGQRNYFCFVNRSSGDPLSGSLVPTAE